MKRRVFISKAIDEEKLPFSSNQKLIFGKAHYSWKIIANLYERGLTAAGLAVQEVVRPEIYQAKISQETLGLRNNDFHVAVKPIEHIRSFPGIRNVFICGWEFPEFSNKPFEGNPFFNQIAILRHADQVWCWSRYTENNLRAHGVINVVTMPPPVLIKDDADDSSVLNVNALPLNTTRTAELSDVHQIGHVLKMYEGSTIFLSILNPFDLRKQLPMMLNAFKEALTINGELVLIIKIVIDNVHTTLGSIQQILPIHYNFNGVLDRVLFVGDSLSNAQMRSLMTKAHYYLSTASTEGLNLPLIEAMSEGVVPISTNATAMADYVNEENAFILKHEKAKTGNQYHFLHERLTTTHFPPVQSSVVEALIKASKLSKSAYAEKSNRARQQTHAKYSISAFVDRFKEIGAGGNDRQCKYYE